MVKDYSSISVNKYRLELIEILDEIIDYKPSLLSHIGATKLFNWRAIFDFSSEAWSLFDCESRTEIVNALAEKRSLFIALMTFKTMYIEMNRPDIASAAGLSLARFLEDLIEPVYPGKNGNFDLTVSENFL